MSEDKEQTLYEWHAVSRLKNEAREVEPALEQNSKTPEIDLVPEQAKETEISEEKKELLPEMDFKEQKLDETYCMIKFFLLNPLNLVKESLPLCFESIIKRK